MLRRLFDSPYAFPVIALLLASTLLVTIVAAITGLIRPLIVVAVIITVEVFIVLWWALYLRCYSTDAPRTIPLGAVACDIAMLVAAWLLVCFEGVLGERNAWLTGGVLIVVSLFACRPKRHHEKAHKIGG